jgi:cytochrome c
MAGWHWAWPHRPWRLPAVRRRRPRTPPPARRRQRHPPSFTGDAAKGKTAFITCQTCHAVEAGVNKIGPSLHGIVGRTAGSIAGYTYSAANKNSGITWTPEKLFQYLEKPQRVVPGTKMAFPGIPDPQKRADVIAYLQTNG